MIFHQVKEGEFRRLVETKSMTKLLAQESKMYTNKFHVIGVDEHHNLAYVIRHGRTADLRCWRLDNLAALVKGMGFNNIEVQLRQE